MKMNEITCRFYGRFVMVESDGPVAGKVSVRFMLPNMSYGCSGLREHKPLLTIGRHLVDHQNTTLLPTYRTMTDGDVQQAEDFVWDLSGWTMDVGATGGVSLTEEAGKELVDLVELETIQGRRAKLRSDLRPARRGIVAAAITVGGGVGHARTGFHTPPSVFVPLSAAGEAELNIRREAKFQTDLVEIVLPVDASRRLTLADEGGATGQITLREGIGLTIGISNLCNELPHQVTVDREFGQYYQILEYVAADRLVPLVMASAGDEDCNRQARFRA